MHATDLDLTPKHRGELASPDAAAGLSESASTFKKMELLSLPRLHVLALVILWLGGVASGAVWLWRYESAAGSEAAAPAQWPSDSSVGARPTPGSSEGSRLPLVLLFAHPRCVCTLASLDELEWLLSHSQDRVEAWVVLVVPPGAPPDWEQGEIARRAAAIPGVRVWTDRGGFEAQRFGARTSGQVLLYDTAGRLAFRGGLTPGRGQRGAAGSSRSPLPGLEYLRQVASAPVFGCPLFDPVACDAGGPACQR